MSLINNRLCCKCNKAINDYDYCECTICYDSFHLKCVKNPPSDSISDSESEEAHSWMCTRCDKENARLMKPPPKTKGKQR